MLPEQRLCRLSIQVRIAKSPLHSNTKRVSLPLYDCLCLGSERMPGLRAQMCFAAGVNCIARDFRSIEILHLGVTAEPGAPFMPRGLRVLDHLAEQRLEVGGRVGCGGLAATALALLGVALQLLARLPFLLLPLLPPLALCLLRRLGSPKSGINKGVHSWAF